MKFWMSTLVALGLLAGSATMPVWGQGPGQGKQGPFGKQGKGGKGRGGKQGKGKQGKGKQGKGKNPDPTVPPAN